MSQTASAASVAIFKHDHVLLIQRAREPLKGYWSLPGGKLETHETAIDCARREIFEELSLQLIDLTSVTQLTSGSHVLAVFASHMPNAIPAPSDEIMDWHFVRPDDIFDLETTPGLAEVLAEARLKLALV